jgi:hypothetical protein
VGDNEGLQHFIDNCFSHATARRKQLATSGSSLAHYTTAENGLAILKGRSIWLRNAQVMNDHSEIIYGRALLEKMLHDRAIGHRFSRALNEISDGMADRIATWTGMGGQIAESYTYLTSLSEFPDSDDLGKLSMWRAYGGTTGGVALVFSNDVWEGDNNQLGVYYSPILYADAGRFREEFIAVTEYLERETEAIRKLDGRSVTQTIYRALQYAVLSTKHPGFAEEREWRLIHSPVEDPSSWVSSSAESIRGVPQIVYKVPLQDLPGLKMPQLTFPRLLKRVVIGPCLYPKQIEEAYVHVLMQGGVTDPRSHITQSTIPLRQWG